MSKQLTAIWNTYGMVGDEQLRAASVGAKMAAQTAVDFSDIAQAMQTAAAPAAQMGVEYNQLAAIIATVGDATQQSASIIGNAYKTIFSRFQQLVSDGTDGEVTLGAVSSKLQNLGVQLLNSDGTLKNLGQTINEVGQNWNNWTEEQQLAIAQLVGGTRQYGQFLSLMQNFDKYQKNLNSARTETGSTLEQQYTQALDSIESRAENAAEAWHRAFSNVFNADQIKTFYKVIEQTGEAAGSFLEAIGGAPGIFLAIATLLSGRIVPSLATAVNMGKQFGLSLTPGGRESTIKKDFNEQRERISNDNKLSADQKAIATSKANFSQNTALANERINQQLKTATGEYRVQLEMQKEQLETAQRTYQESLDEESSLKRKVELDQIRVNKLREALAIMDETQAANQQELANAQNTQQNAVAKQRQAQADLNSLLNTSQGKFSGSEEMKEKMKNQEQAIANGALNDPGTRATIRNYEELEGRIKQVVAAEERLKQATLEVAKANDAVAAAQKKVNMDQEAAKAADLAGKYNEIAQAVVKYDQARMLEGGGGKESDALIARIEEYIRLAPQASEEVEELNRRLEKLKNGEEGASLESVLEGIQNVNAATGADGVEANGIRVTQNADALIDEHTRQEQAIKAQEEAQRKLAEQQKLTLQQGISAAVQFGMVLTSVTMAVKNLISVWSDDSDATVFEKIGKSIGIIGTMALTAIPSVMSIISAVTALGTASGATGMAAFKAGLMAQTGLGPLLPVVLAITAAVVALTVVIGLIADAIKKADPRYQLEQAQKDAAAFAESLNEAKQEAEELKKAFDSYDEIQNKLKRCTIGTQEWKDALQEANNQVLELIRKYPELASHVETSMVNGQRVLSINKEGMDALQKQQDTIVANLTAASVSSNQRVRDAEIVVQKSDLIKEIGYNTLTTTREYQAGQGYSGNQSYQVGQTSAVIDKYMKEILSATPDQMEALAEKIIKEQNLDQSIDSVKKTLEEMIPSLREYDAAITEATEAKKIENQMLADSIIQNSERLSSVKDSNAMEAGGAVYGNAYKKAYDDALKAAQSRTWYNGGTEDSKASFKAYAEGLKLKDWKVTNYKGSGKDASVEYEYYDDEGKKQTGEATAEMIARFNAAAVAGEELENSLIALAKEADRLADSEDSGDQALSSFLGKGNLEGATQGQFNDIKNDVQEAGDVRKYLEGQFDDLEKVAESAGYADAEAFVKAFEKSLQIDWDSIPEGLSSIESLTLEQAKALGETYTKVMNISGEQAAQQYADGIKRALEGVDVDDLMAVQNMFAAIDWTNEDALNNFANGMRDLGYEIDMNDKEWVQLADTMRATFKVQPDLDKLVASIKEANDIAEGIDLGGIISQEDYQTLVAYNSELSKYFTILADGTAMMTGDILDFQQEMRETEQKKLEDSIAAYKQQVQELKGVSGSQNYVNDKGENKYRTSNVNTQLDYIEANGGASAEQIAAWREDLSDNQSTVGVIDAIGEAFDKLGVNAETAQAKLQQASTQLALSQETFEDLRGTLTGTEEATIAYGQALGALHNKEKWEGMDPKEVEDYAKGLQKAAKSSDLLSDKLEENAEAAEDVALYTKKMNQGIDKLADGFKDWSDILKKSDKGSEEYISAMSDMKDAMSDVLGVSEEFLSDDFILKNMEDIKLAAEGDAEAINRLAIAAGKDIIMHMGIEDEGVLEKALILHSELTAMIPDIEVGATLSGDDEFAQKALELIKTVGMTADQANAYFRSIGFEPNFEFEEVTDTQDIIGTRTTTSNVVADTVPLQRPDGSTEYFGYIKSADTVEEPVVTGQREVTVAVPKLSADGQPAADISFTRTNNGHNNNYSKKNSGGGKPGSGSKGGGGGSKSKTPEYKKQKRNDDVGKKYEERYTNIDSAIKEVTQTLEKLNDAEEDAWGPQKVRNLQAINRQLSIQNRNYSERLRQARAWLEVDKTNLLSTSKNRGAKGLGLSDTDLQAMFQFNDNGSIANRETVIRQLYETYVKPFEDAANALIDDYNSKGVGNDAATENIEKANEKLEEQQGYVEAIVELMDQVDETSDEIYETWQNIINGMREMVSGLVKEIQTKYEFRIRIDDRDLTKLSNMIDRLGEAGVVLGDTFDKMWEKADAISKKLSDVGRSFSEADNLLNEFISAGSGADQAMYDQVRSYFFGKNLSEDEAARADEMLKSWLDGNAAMPEEIMSFMQDLRDEMVDVGEELVDHGLEMLDNIMTQVNNWFDKTFGEADHIIELSEAKLDLAQRILDFKGTSNLTVAGRQANKDIMAGRMNVAQATLDRNMAEKVAKQDYVKELEKSIDVWENVMKTAKEGTLEYNNAAAQRNALYQEREEAMQAIQDLETEIVNSTTQIIEIAAENIEKEKEIAKSNIAIAMNGLFSDISDMMNMYSIIDEEKNLTLDDYDKNYHLNRLQNKYNDAVEDLNPEQLEKLQDWQERLNKYKEEGVEMTQSEVDLLEKALEVEMARADFEDQRNNKNTMRLQRDASGNYAYVYSGDGASSEESDKLAQLEYEYKKLLEQTEDAFNESVMNTAEKLQQEIENIDYQLYYSSELYRRSVDVKISSLVNQMEKSGAAASQVLEIMGSGVKGWEYDFSQSTAGVITQTTSMQSMLEKFKNALVGPDGYVPGSSDKNTYYGAIMEAQRYWAEVANTKLQESTGETFGFIDEDIKGHVVNIAGPNGYYHTLIIETQEVGEIVDGVLVSNQDSVTNKWNEAEGKIHETIGDGESTDPGTVNGNLNILKNKMTEIKNHQNTQLNGMLSSLATFTTSWEEYYRRQVAAIQSLIDKMAEYEDRARQQMDDEPDVSTGNRGGNDPQTPTTPPITGGPTTTPQPEQNPGQKPLSSYPVADQKGIAYAVWNGTAGWGNGQERKNKLEEKFGPGAYQTYQSVVNQHDIIKKAKNGTWTSDIGIYDYATLRSRYGYQAFETGGYTGNDEGLAFLHEKELILNAKDTENILAAVSLMRQTVQSQFGGINGSLLGVTRGIASAAQTFSHESQTVDQQVRIEASFPGVSVAQEIEDALNSLITQAAQYNIKK